MQDSDNFDLISNSDDYLQETNVCPHCGETFNRNEIERLEEMGSSCTCPVCGRRINLSS
jgi:hypothetical protein